MYCEPFDDQGRPFVPWIKQFFGDCVYSPKEMVGMWIGISSIVCWLCAQLPQVYKNYQRKRTESLSWIFISVWLVGDISNLIGCFLTHQLPFQRYLATYFVIVDGFILGQMIYYTHVRRSNVDEEVYQALLQPDLSQLPKNNPGSQQYLTRHDISDISTDIGSIPAVSGNRNYGAIPRQVLMISIVCVVLPFADTFAVGTFGTPEPPHLPDIPAGPGEGKKIMGEYVIGQIFAWTSLVCYLSSRMPQIWKNYQRSSVVGLSVWMFIFAALGNTTYTISILLKSTDSDFLLRSLPYLLGSGGTLVFDLTIFLQYIYYSQLKQYTQL